MVELRTARLRLLALTPDHLRQYLASPGRLAATLGFTVSREIINEPLRRAIAGKLADMAGAPVETHPWHTYWLIIIEADPFGAGMAGFKGLPDETGEVEIGYGIDPAYRNRGYITEAVAALISWAFDDRRCHSVLAVTSKSNVPSNRVAEKLGMIVAEEDGETRSWRISKEAWRNRLAGQEKTADGKDGDSRG